MAKAKEGAGVPGIAFKGFGDNFEIGDDDTHIYFRMEKGKEFGPSKSKKTIILASTGGNKRFETKEGEDITFGLNSYKKNPNYKGEDKD